MAAVLSSPEQYATSPSWPQLDMILRDRLCWLHHSLSCDLLPAAEAAAQFSNIVFDLLMEYGVVHCTQPRGRHHPRHIETTLRNLAVMKNDSRKFMQRDNGNFLTLVRSHNRVLQCYHRQVNNRETCRQERDFR